MSRTRLPRSTISAARPAPARSAHLRGDRLGRQDRHQGGALRRAGAVGPGQAHRSVKSYNNHTGVPLSLARMPRDARYGVFEMGMNHAGELAALTRLVRPHVAIITAIASAHREFFNSEEEIADAKGEIFQGWSPAAWRSCRSIARIAIACSPPARPHAATIRTFGLGDGADIRARDVVAAPRGGSLVTTSLPDAELTYTISQPGEHWVSNSLAVLAAVQALGGDLALAGLALADMAGLKGRGERHRIALAGGEAMLVDESYNANPSSMRATLKTLAEEKAAGRRIAVLGAMRELGEGSDDFHAGLAEPIAAACVEHAILVGQEMLPLLKALGQKVNAVHVPDAAAATDALREVIRPGDAVLVKGSNSVGLSALVESLAGGKG
jgi:UDP-N-acetylmuramoyl-tripeptide--D-alanyl-D-alanine ligase